MAELVNDSTDTVDLNRRGAGHIAQQLCRAGIVLQIDAIPFDSPKSTAMRPPEVFVIATIIGTIAGNNKKDQIDISVAIAIVILEIHITDNIGRIDGSFQYLTNFTTRFNVAVVLAVFHLIGTSDIKLRLELTIRIVRKIIAYTARKLSIVKPRKAFLIDHIGNYLRIVFTRKALVVKLNEDNKPPEITIIGSSISLRTTTCKDFLLSLLHQLALLYLTFGHIRSLIFLNSRQIGLL